MKETTCKKLQEIGAFALAGGCTRKRMKQLVEMIRAARNYRWLAVYKIVKDEFVILAGTGNEPPAYPQFPTTQGLCGAALESGKPIIVGDVHKDPRHLPAFHTNRSISCKRIETRKTPLESQSTMTRETIVRSKPRRTYHMAGGWSSPPSKN